MPALTGGLIAVEIKQVAHFNAFFLRFANIPQNSASDLLGVAALAYFTPLGFMLSYSLTATVGALAFKQAEESLVAQGAIMKTFPPLPDLPTDSTLDQIAATTTSESAPIVGGELCSQTARQESQLEEISLQRTAESRRPQGSRGWRQNGRPMP
ncbi:MAG: hypothetical protein NVSMB64_14450 [Candidatus Velthaea sp.]